MLIILNTSSLLIGKEVGKYEFQFIKILEHGKKQKFKAEEIDVEEISNNKFTVEKNKNEIYPFYIKLKKEDIGKLIKLKIKNKLNWIIVSPINGELSISKNMKAKIKILVVRKYTEIYYDIFSDYEYSVQVFYTKRKDKALQIRDDLIRDKYKAYYEAIPILPNKGYTYKIKVGEFSKIEDAEKLKNKIQRWYPTRFKDCFITGRMR